MDQPHVSIKPDILYTIGTFQITNSLFTTWVLLFFFLILALMYTSALKTSPKSLFVVFIRHMTQSLYSLFEGILGTKIKQFFPLLASFFLFILLSNWLGLLPGVGSVLVPSPSDETHDSDAYDTQMYPDTQTDAYSVPAYADGAYGDDDHDVHLVPLLRAGTADLNTTIALGLLAVILVQYYGITHLGFLAYSKKFINFSNPIAFFTGVLEIVSEISKVISFAFRLFGNIFAGEVLLVVVAFLVPVVASFPFLILEVFVGFIQALVFSMLLAVFINMSMHAHE